MAKRQMYEHEAFCTDCDAKALVLGPGASAADWARGHNEQHGHETITRLSFVYPRPALKQDASLK